MCAREHTQTHTHRHTHTQLPHLFRRMQRGEGDFKCVLSPSELLPFLWLICSILKSRLRPPLGCQPPLPTSAANKSSHAAKKALEKPQSPPSPPRAFEVSLSSDQYQLQLQIPDSFPTWSPGFSCGSGQTLDMSALIFIGLNFYPA